MSRRYGDAQQAAGIEDAFFAAHLDLGPGSVLLDIGCSTGFNFTRLPATGARLVGLDMSLLALTIGHHAWQAAGRSNEPVWCAADLNHMPFADGSITHATSYVVLAAVPLRPALREVRRVLAPGGRFVFTLEGPGFRQEVLDHGQGTLRERISLMRWWLGSALLERGVDWQRHPLTRRITGYPQYTTGVVERLATAEGFKVRDSAVLDTYKGEARVIAIAIETPA